MYVSSNRLYISAECRTGLGANYSEVNRQEQRLLYLNGCSQ